MQACVRADHRRPAFRRMRTCLGAALLALFQPPLPALPHSALSQVVGPDTLPLEYGGTAAEVPVEVAARQLPAWRQQVLETEGAAVAEQQQVSSATAASEALERPSRALRHSESTSDLQLAI